jgi:hypothetical protein
MQIQMSRFMDQGNETGLHCITTDEPLFARYQQQPERNRTDRSCCSILHAHSSGFVLNSSSKAGKRLKIEGSKATPGLRREQ